MKVNVVMIRSNPVRPDSRVEKEAVTLFDAGYNVIILCWDRDENHSPFRETINVAGKEIPIVRLGYKATFGEGMKNIVPYLKFQWSIRKWIKKNIKQIDIVHACDFDTAFSTYRLVSRKGKKFVFDIFDFRGGARVNFKEKLLARAQYDIINKSDATIICTEERKKQIAGSKPKKLVVIHNTPAPFQLQIDGSYEVDDKIAKVCYVGILQDGRLLREIGQYFRDNKNVELHIAGFGYLQPYFEELAKENSNIMFYGRIAYEKALALEKSCDIMLAIYDPSIENHRFAGPNKFYESLFLGKPVIMVKNTGMSDVVAKNEVGAIIDYSYEGFANGLQSLLKKRDLWPSIGKKMRKIYSNEYSWDEMRIRLLECYKSIF